MQFHLETTPGAVAAFVTNCRKDLRLGPYVQPIEQLFGYRQRFLAIKDRMQTLLRALVETTFLAKIHRKAVEETVKALLHVYSRAVTRYRGKEANHWPRSWRCSRKLPWRRAPFDSMLSELSLHLMKQSPLEHLLKRKDPCVEILKGKNQEFVPSSTFLISSPMSFIARGL